MTSIFNIMLRTKALIIIVAMLVLASCGDGKSNNFQFVSANPDGKLTILNQKSGQLIVINKSDRIDDIVDLKLRDEDVAKIKARKEKQDAALKIKSWGNSEILGTLYKVSLSTRYYKDKMLYTVTFSPHDSMSAFRARTIVINLHDENGFVLEKFSPESWSSIIDESNKPLFEQATGEIPMTLDNYLEIANYSPTWYFK